MAPRKGAAPQEGEGRKPFLDLDAVAEKVEPTAGSETAVKLDGRYYELAQRADLSIADQENLTRFYSMLNDVTTWAPDALGFLTQEQEDLMEACEVRVCCIALPGAPATAFEGHANRRRRTHLVEAFPKAVDHTPFLMRAVRKAQREIQNQQQRPRLVRGNDSDTTANATPASSPDSSSKAEAA